jgi:hypothetical protein
MTYAFFRCSSYDNWYDKATVIYPREVFDMRILTGTLIAALLSACAPSTQQLQGPVVVERPASPELN